MELGGHRNNSATKAGISESQCDCSGVLYSTRGEEPRRGSYDANKGLIGGYDPVTRTAGSLSLGGGEGVKEDVPSGWDLRLFGIAKATDENVAT
jgi:hypothetical protein